MFVGVSNAGEAFGIELDEIDKTKNLIARINDRHIFPHARIRYMMRSVDANAERFVLAVNVAPADSVVRYREGDFNETVYIKGDGNSTPATPEDIISLSKRKYGVDNETSEILYEESGWKEYLDLCREYRKASTVPTIKELQNEEIISKDGYACRRHYLSRWKYKVTNGTYKAEEQLTSSVSERYVMYRNVS